MSYLKHRLLLYLLHGLIYGKRTLAWLLQNLLTGLNDVAKWTSGFGFLRLYKIHFSYQKWLGQLPVFCRRNHWLEMLNRRSTLQNACFLLILFFLIPDSQLYSKSFTSLPGRGTLLYEIVGPGWQDFPLEEIISDTLPVLSQTTSAPSWKEGAVKTSVSGSGENLMATLPLDFVALGSGGTAVIKPTIIPGAVLPTVSGGSPPRQEVIFYEVRAGDTVTDVASKYNISIATILWANNLSAYSYIRPGDKLKIPPIDGVLHKVVKGETVVKIAKLYKAAEADIIQFNKLQTDGSDIQIGEELVIPYGTKPQPVYVPDRRYTALSQISAPPPSLSAPAGAGYIWPTTARRITQYFGWRHTGVDIAGPVGTPIYASRSGRVIKSQCGWNGGYGCYIIIDHGSGIRTLYSHNSRLFVKAGEEIVQGQSIAAMGSTGRSTGAHLHFEIHINGQRVNPLRYVK